MGEYAMKRLAEWPKKHPLVGDVRGLGLMIGIELVKSQKTREPNLEARKKIIQRAYELGVLVLGCGESTVRLMPPLLVEQDQIDFGLDTLERCIADIEK
jgi:4-aminobutyrate aminotransferase